MALKIFCQETLTSDWTALSVVTVILRYYVASVGVCFPTFRNHYVVSKHRRTNSWCNGIITQKNTSTTPLQNPKKIIIYSSHWITWQKPTTEKQHFGHATLRCFPPSPCEVLSLYLQQAKAWTNWYTRAVQKEPGLVLFPRYERAPRVAASCDRVVSFLDLSHLVLSL